MDEATMTAATTYEFLKLERDAPYKSEYVDGEIFAMAGASTDHNTICFNVAGLLWVQLEGTPCRGLLSDSRTAVVPDRFYTYPDISVVCGEPVSFTCVNPRNVKRRSFLTV